MKKFEKWLSECPYPVLQLNEGEFEMRMVARFVCSSSHVYEKNTHVVMSLDDLKKILKDKNETND
jgi:hypothetical protein